ncbi:MAG: cytochrome c biogenesis protein CcdA [Aliidongia sp.]
MTLFVLAYLAGVLTIATPCIVPILPFVMAGAGGSFRRGALPLLLGLAVSFAAVASLAGLRRRLGGGCEPRRPDRRPRADHAVRADDAPAWTGGAPDGADRGDRIQPFELDRAARDRQGATAVSSMLLGVATGLVWAPCAGPVLGLILTGAALQGPGVGTSLLLLAYGLGAASSLAAGILLAGRLLAVFKRSARWADGFRRVLGAAVIAGAAVIWLGLDTGLLTRLSSASTSAVEQNLITALQDGTPLTIGSAAYAAPAPALSGPVTALLGAKQWLNGPPLRAEDLRGKVVVVNFWTYSCINCLRLLPYSRGWAEKYKDRGPRRHRCAHTGIRLRERHRQCDQGERRARRRLSGRDR